MLTAGSKIKPSVMYEYTDSGRAQARVEAERHLAQAVKYAPQSVESWYYLGMARQQLGRHAQAAEALTQAAALAGFGSDTQLRRAWHQFGRSGTPSQGVRQRPN